jgi:hypothetical protein
MAKLTSNWRNRVVAAQGEEKGDFQITTDLWSSETLDAPTHAWKAFRRMVDQFTKPLGNRRIQRSTLLRMANFMGLGTDRSDHIIKALLKPKPPSYRCLVKRILQQVAQIEPLWRTVQLACERKVGWSVDDADPLDTLTTALDYTWFLQVLCSTMEERDSDLHKGRQVLGEVFARIQANRFRATCTPAQTWFARTKTKALRKILRQWVEQPQHSPIESTLAEACGNTKVSRQLYLNVTMAMIQDAMNGFFNNASAGLEISTQTHDSQQHDFQWQHRYHPPAPTDHLARSVLCFTPFPLQWCELYLSWNLAFIL